MRAKRLRRHPGPSLVLLGTFVAFCNSAEHEEVKSVLHNHLFNSGDVSNGIHKISEVQSNEQTCSWPCEIFELQKWRRTGKSMTAIGIDFGKPFLRVGGSKKKTRSRIAWLYSCSCVTRYHTTSSLPSDLSNFNSTKATSNISFDPLFFTLQYKFRTIIL